jgi:hypothetical protein
MKMYIPTRWSNTDFKQWKMSLLTFMSLKAAYLIPKLAIRETGVLMDEAAQCQPKQAGIPGGQVRL